MKAPLRLFCCYARCDKPYLEELKKHLAVLQREGLINIKDDTDISPGMIWEKAIHSYLERAQIILLLISSDFIFSEYCYDTEVQKALIRHQQGTACVIPVIIRTCSWKELSFGELQALPTDARAVSEWLNRDEAYTSITEGIRTVVQKSLPSNRVGTISPPTNTHTRKQPAAPPQQFMPTDSGDIRSPTHPDFSSHTRSNPSVSSPGMASRLDLLAIYRGHADYQGYVEGVHAIKWSPDGKSIASVGTCTMRIWDVATRQTNFLNATQNEIPDVAWSPDGRYIASLFASHEPYHAPMPSPAELDILEGLGAPKSPRPLSYSGPWKTPTEMWIWETATRKKISTQSWGVQDGLNLHEQKTIPSLAWSPQRDFIAINAITSKYSGKDTGEFFGQVRSAFPSRWSFFNDTKPVLLKTDRKTDRTSRYPRPTVFDEPRPQQPLLWAPDGQHIAFAETDGTVFVLGFPTGQIILKYHHSETITAMRWATDGKSLAVARTHGIVEEIELAFQNKIGEYRCSSSHSIQSASWSPDGAYVASVTDEAIMEIWDTHTKNRICTMNDYRDVNNAYPRNIAVLPSSSFKIVSWSPDGKYIALTISGGNIAVCRCINF